MNDYFIHTFELSYRTSLDTIRELTNNKLAEINGEYSNLKYVDNGITIISRKCPKEGKDGKGNYKLILVINPSKLTDPEAYSNNIKNLSEFKEVMGILDYRISKLFTGFEIDDFKLSRIDITKDISVVPERIIQEYILIMRGSSLSIGYKMNTELEENTPNFRCEDSFNVLNKSRGAEFVVYNKHRASIDQGYPSEQVYGFENTMRVELRCKRRFINKVTKGQTTYEALCTIYNKKALLVEEYYDTMFKYRTDLCYVSKEWQKKLIKAYYGDKVKSAKLLKVLKEISDKGLNLDMALYECYNSRNARIRGVTAFNEMGFSPIPIKQKTISYMSPIDTVLGFDNESNCKCYKKIKHSKGRKKVIFRYEDYRSSDDR